MITLPVEPSAGVFHLDTDRVLQLLTSFIREEVAMAGRRGVVLGLSGGLDSSLVANLSVRALGAENVHGYMLPFRTSSIESLAHARLEADRLGIQYRTVGISPVADALFAHGFYGCSTPPRHFAGTMIARRQVLRPTQIPPHR